MKATGIVRRIDELGRIVIPKELRKTLRIREGETLEIYVDDKENIILKRFSLMNQMEDFAQDFVDSMHSFMKHNIMITDSSRVIAYAGKNKKEYINKPISEKLQDSLKKREMMLEKYEKEYMVVDQKKESGTYAIGTILAGGDAVGLVVITSSEEALIDIDKKVLSIASHFLGKYLEQ